MQVKWSNSNFSNVVNFGQVNPTAVKKIVLNADYAKMLGESTTITKKGFFDVITLSKPIEFDGDVVIPSRTILSGNLKANNLEIEGDFIGDAQAKESITIATDSDSIGSFKSEVINVWGKLKEGSKIVSDKVNRYWTKTLNGVEIKTPQEIGVEHMVDFN